jgi:hypothetical protein
MSTIDAQATISLLPLDVQASLAAAGKVAQDNAPLISMASTVSKGMQLSEPQIVAGLAAAGTAIGGPIAGAALAAAGGLVSGIGEALTSVFQSLGMTDTISAAAPVIGLRPAQATLPWGVGDPIWWKVRTRKQFADIMNKMIVVGQYAPDFGPGKTILSDALDDLASTPDAKRGGKAKLKTPVYAASGPKDAIMPDGGNGPGYQNWVLNDFDRYFLPILILNLEGWANGSGYIKPRDLLRVSVNAWNTQHGNEKMVTYTPYPPNLHDGREVNAVRDILSGGGDMRGIGSANAPPITVNLGHLITPADHPKILVLPKGAILLPSGATWVPPVPIKASYPAQLPAKHVHWVSAAGGAGLGFLFGGPLGAAIGAGAGYIIGRVIE